MPQNEFSQEREDRLWAATRAESVVGVLRLPFHCEQWVSTEAVAEEKVGPQPWLPPERWLQHTIKDQIDFATMACINVPDGAIRIALRGLPSEEWGPTSPVFQKVIRDLLASIGVAAFVEETFKAVEEELEDQQ